MQWKKIRVHQDCNRGDFRISRAIAVGAEDTSASLLRLRRGLPLFCNPRVEDEYLRYQHRDFRYYPPVVGVVVCVSLALLFGTLLPGSFLYTLTVAVVVALPVACTVAVWILGVGGTGSVSSSGGGGGGGGGSAAVDEEGLRGSIQAEVRRVRLLEVLYAGMALVSGALLSVGAVAMQRDVCPHGADSFLRSASFAERQSLCNVAVPICGVLPVALFAGSGKVRFVVAVPLMAVVVALSAWKFLTLQSAPLGPLNVFVHGIVAAVAASQCWAQEVALRTQFAACATRQWHVARTARQVSTVDRYLASLVPKQVYRRLVRQQTTVDVTPSATIVLLEIPDFAAWCTQALPQTAARVATVIFERVEQACSDNGLAAIARRGDRFLAAGNVLQPSPRHAVNALEFALAVHAVMVDASLRTGLRSSFRVAVHTGPAVGAVVGTRFLHYDVFGDCVVDASRLLALARPGETLLTTTTFAALPASELLFNVVRTDHTLQPRSAPFPLSSGPSGVLPLGFSSSSLGPGGLTSGPGGSVSAHPVGVPAPLGGFTSPRHGPGALSDRSSVRSPSPLGSPSGGGGISAAPAAELPPLAPASLPAVYGSGRTRLPVLAASIPAATVVAGTAAGATCGDPTPGTPAMVPQQATPPFVAMAPHVTANASAASAAAAAAAAAAAGPTLEVFLLRGRMPSLAGLFGPAASGPTGAAGQRFSVVAVGSAATAAAGHPMSFSGFATVAAPTVLQPATPLMLPALVSCSAPATPTRTPPSTALQPLVVVASPLAGTNNNGVAAFSCMPSGCDTPASSASTPTGVSAFGGWVVPSSTAVTPFVATPPEAAALEPTSAGPKQGAVVSLEPQPVSAAAVLDPPTASTFSGAAAQAPLPPLPVPFIGGAVPAVVSSVLPSPLVAMPVGTATAPVGMTEVVRPSAFNVLTIAPVVPGGGGGGVVAATPPQLVRLPSGTPLTTFMAATGGFSVSQDSAAGGAGVVATAPGRPASGLPSRPSLIRTNDVAAAAVASSPGGSLSSLVTELRANAVVEIRRRVVGHCATLQRVADFNIAAEELTMREGAWVSFASPFAEKDYEGSPGSVSPTIPLFAIALFAVGLFVPAVVMSERSGPYAPGSTAGGFVFVALSVAAVAPLVGLWIHRRWRRVDSVGGPSAPLTFGDEDTRGEQEDVSLGHRIDGDEAVVERSHRAREALFVSVAVASGALYAAASLSRIGFLGNDTTYITLVLLFVFPSIASTFRLGAASLCLRLFVIVFVPQTATLFSDSGNPALSSVVVFYVMGLVVVPVWTLLAQRADRRTFREARLAEAVLAVAEAEQEAINGIVAARFPAPIVPLLNATRAAGSYGTIASYSDTVYMHIEFASISLREVGIGGHHGPGNGLGSGVGTGSGVAERNMTASFSASGSVTAFSAAGPAATTAAGAAAAASEPSALLASLQARLRSVEKALAALGPSPPLSLVSVQGDSVAIGGPFVVGAPERAVHESCTAAMRVLLTLRAGPWRLAAALAIEQAIVALTCEPFPACQFFGPVTYLARGLLSAAPAAHMAVATASFVRTFVWAVTGAPASVVGTTDAVVGRDAATPASPASRAGTPVAPSPSPGLPAFGAAGAGAPAVRASAAASAATASSVPPGTAGATAAAGAGSASAGAAGGGLPDFFGPLETWRLRALGTVQVHTIRRLPLSGAGGGAVGPGIFTVATPRHRDSVLAASRSDVHASAAFAASVQSLASFESSN